MTADLVCRGVLKHLGGRPILANLDLDVKAGEVVSLLGASGSGKTTLLRCIAGLIDPDDGEIILDGKTVWSRDEVITADRRRIGMVFQDYALWPHMTVQANLSFALKSQKLSQRDIDARVTHASEMARLEPLMNRYPSELSGGQQQRVAIARCLAARPAIMLFDEPLSNLDAALREDIRSEMMDLVRQENITVIYVTHDQAEAMAVSDRIAVMRAGTIAQYATPQEIYANPADKFVASFIGGFSIIPGIVRDGNFIIEDGVASMHVNSPLQGDAVIVIRPEDAVAGDVCPVSGFSGTVLACAYQGRCWRITLGIGQHRIKIDWPHTLELGKTVAVSIPTEKIVVLAG